MKKVCFVCLGNICRSPMAEFVMKSLLGERDWLIESRGTSDWEMGNPIHGGTQGIFKTYGISYNPHKSSQRVSQSDLENFDYILAMDETNLADLMALATEEQVKKIHLFGDKSVPDPWYTGDFEETYELVKSGCEAWIRRIDGGELSGQN